MSAPTAAASPTISTEVKRAAALLAIALLASPAHAPAARVASVTLGPATIDLPAAFDGWTRKDAHDGVLLQQSFAPANGRKGFALVLMTTPKPQGASFDLDFDAFVHSIRQIRRDEKAFIVQDGKTADGHRIHVEQRCCRTTEDVSMNAWHVGVQTPGQEQFFMLLLIRLERADENRLRDAFQAMIRSLRPLPADHGFVLVPKPDPEASIDGLFSRTVNGLSPNVYGGLDFTSSQETLLFDPGGLYTTEMPADGIAEHCRDQPQSCGTYRLSGSGAGMHLDRMEVENPFGMVKRSSDPAKRDADSLTIGTDSYRAIPKAPAGQRFDGVWTSLWGSSGPTGSLGGTRTLTLHRDGRFSREGFTGFSSMPGAGSTGATVVGQSTRPLEAGRYQVEGYRLTLSGDDGRRETLSLFEPDVGSDSLLVIGGANYLKQGR